MTPEHRARLIAALESDYVPVSEYMFVEINEYEEADIVLAVSELKRIEKMEKAISHVLKNNGVRENWVSEEAIAELREALI